MESPDESKCTNCGGKMATFFLTTIVSGTKESRKLCKECYEGSLSGPAKDFVEAMKQARCRFCGGKAAMSDAIPRVIHGSDQEMQFLCFSCGSEYNRLLATCLEKAGNALNDAPHAEQERLLHLALQEVDAHMRGWVIQRDN